MLSRLGVWRQPRPNALESTFFGKLPPEVLLCIAEFLPRASAAAFTLCCRHFCCILGNSTFAAVKDGDELETMREFLALLERDLPNHLACFYCGKLHSIKKASSYKRSSNSHRLWGRGSELQCFKVDQHFDTAYYIHWDFSHVVFQMAMKRYRQGLDFTNLLQLLSQNGKTKIRNDYTEQESFQARIVAGCLIVRLQTIFVYSALLERFSLAPQFRICPHYVYDVGKKGISRDYRQWVRGGGSMKCECCLTEFQLDVKVCGEMDIATYCTKWQNLGEGKSPLDLTWQRHLAR